MKRTEETQTVVTLMAPVTNPKGLVIKDRKGDITLYRAFMVHTIECIWPNPMIALSGHWGDDPEATKTNVKVLFADLPPELQAQLRPEERL